MFITFEGVEGCGKTTLLHTLAARLTDSGRSVTTAREPGGTATGERIRAIFLEPGIALDPLAEALLLNASRAHLMSEVIRPALARHEDVLCDRFTDSTLAYQGFGRGLNLETVQRICDAATDGRVPDLTFLIDVPVEIARQRLLARLEASHEAQDRVEREDNSFHEKVRAGYLQLSMIYSQRIRTLDGRKSAAELADDAMEALAAHIP